METNDLLQNKYEQNITQYQSSVFYIFKSYVYMPIFYVVIVCHSTRNAIRNWKS